MIMCDNGSSNTWITTGLANKLNLSSPMSFQVGLNGINVASTVETGLVEATISCIENDYPFSTKILTLVKDDLNLGDDFINMPELQEKYPQLAPLQPEAYKYSDVQVILGQNYFYAFKQIESFESPDVMEPCAVRGAVGWLLSGPQPKSSNLQLSGFKANIDDVLLADRVKSWYELESYGAYKNVDPRSAADQRAAKILETTTIHDGERYSVGMLWAEDDVQLPNNYYSSLVQLKSLEKRLDKDPALRSQYAETINSDIDKGYVIKVKDSNLETRSKREWYLPHHPVINPNKPGKVRRVLNGAAKFHGRSLNSSLMTGPDLLQDLFNVLLRFRQRPYAVSADIEGMFLQVGVLQEDQASLRFLWREDPTENVETLQYTRHIFGAKDSPTCANFALQQTARDNQSAFPEAAKAVQEKFYMDDYLDSVDCPEKALLLSKDLVKMLKLGGFKLTKFVSNVPGLAETLEPSLDTPAVKDIATHSPVASHVLGLKWDHGKDTLNVSRGTVNKENDIVTQRIVLSTVSAVFDPLGLVAPYTIKARLMLKDIWKISGQQWDDPLPQNLSDAFIEWCSDLPILAELSIPRAFFRNPVECIELHMFGDSSQDVFCAVGFLRAKCLSSGEAMVRFVVGKARVAPMKPLTIPKLELQAALLAARLKVKILNALTINVQEVFMWTDSTTVLQWIASVEKQPIFVANRVAEIRESVPIEKWFYVPTAQNPADVGTRGLAASALHDSGWVKGPQFLQTNDWPFKPSPESCKLRLPPDNEVVHTVTMISTVAPKNLNKPVLNWSRFSSYTKVVRVVAYLLRLLPKYKHFRSSAKVYVDPVELDNAEKRLLYLAQTECFPSEKKCLLKETPVQTPSRIAAFSPFLGPDLLIRSRSRLRRLEVINYDAKHPLLLDSKHPLSKLLCEHMHEKCHHLGPDYVRAQMSCKYIVLGLRTLLRSIRLRCVACRKRDAQVVNPIMADLPKERLGYLDPPFAYCGVDYFGPFYVSVRRSSEKRWAFLFTCLTIRAVHLEIVPSMDTSSCVAGIERFIARRGMPSVIWSDNGTNFVGADKELTDAVARWNESAPEALARIKLSWKFNPPGAPHHGGPWERMVRSCKRVFYSILGTRRLTDEVLSTTFCLVEQALNARPLTPVTDDPSELDALTPNHFLLGRPSASLPPAVSNSDPNLRKRYTKAQAYANGIWSRWLSEYVTSLHKRSKWHSSSATELKSGDLVWIADGTNPRGYYPLARISSLRYGNDAVARSAELRTATGSLVRPVVKLVPVFGPPSLGPENVKV